MNNYIVYCHTNKINGKKYIGITKNNPRRRWGKAGCQYFKGGYFRNALDKYGWDNFSHDIIYRELSAEQAIEKERELIQKFKTTDKQYGYNATSGGEIRKVYTLETRQKMSLNRKGKTAGEKNPLYGKHHTPEAKAKIRAYAKNRPPEVLKKISAANTGHKITEETRLKLSLAHKGLLIGEKNPMFGRKHTKEAKEKISSANKFPKPHSEEHKKNISLAKIGKKMGKDHPNAVKVLCINTGEIFDAISIARRKYNARNIPACCRGKLKSSGYSESGTRLKWKYVEENN